MLSLSTQAKRNWITLPRYCCAISAVIVCFDAANEHNICTWIYVRAYVLHLVFRSSKCKYITEFGFALPSLRFPYDMNENENEKDRIGVTWSKVLNFDFKKKNKIRLTSSKSYRSSQVQFFEEIAGKFTINTHISIVNYDGGVILRNQSHGNLIVLRVSIEFSNNLVDSNGIYVCCDCFESINIK